MFSTTAIFVSKLWSQHEHTAAFYPQYSILRAIWVSLFLTSTTWSLSRKVAIVSVTQLWSGHLSLQQGQHLRRHPCCLMNKPSYLAGTELCWTHLLSPEQWNNQDGSRAGRALQSVPTIQPPLETSVSDKPRVFDGKNCLPAFINLKQRAFWHHYSVL